MAIDNLAPPRLNSNGVQRELCDHENRALGPV
jgi:hypothetical protein